MPGHGAVMHRWPSSLTAAGLPSSYDHGRLHAEERSRGRARLERAGAGSGVIMMPPVSVCHHVSTIGQRPPPIFSWYHIQASGLMGSPTEPSRRRLDQSCLSTHSSPRLMKERMAVGAV